MSAACLFEPYDVDVIEDGKVILLECQRKKDIREVMGGMGITYSADVYGMLQFYDNEGNYLTSYECGNVIDVEQTSNGDIMLRTPDCVKILKGIMK